MSFSLPRFTINYWVSFSSSHGFQLDGGLVTFSDDVQQSVVPVDREGDKKLFRRPEVWCFCYLFQNLALEDEEEGGWGRKKG